mgnify:CR=1 FL=1
MVGRNIVGHLDDGSKFSTYTPPNDPNLVEKLLRKYFSNKIEYSFF